MTAANPAGPPGQPGLVRLGVWWVPETGLNAVAARLAARRILTDPVVWVVLRKTHQARMTPRQVADWFAHWLPDVVPLADEGFIRFVLAATRPTGPVQAGGDRP